MPIYHDTLTGGFWLILLIIFSRYSFAASMAFFLFYHWNKQNWASRKIQMHFPKGNDYIREIAYSIVTAIIFAGIGHLLFFTPIKSLTATYDSVSDYGWIYFFISIVVMLFIHDTYFYWTHRAMHHPILFKWFHKVHHLSTNPSPWAAYAFHPLEAVVEAGVIVVVAFIMPVHPIAIGLFLLIMIVYNVYGHLGYELYPKGFSKTNIGKWINTSISHNQHHQFFKGNYGLYFLWWDRWMGTLRDDYDNQFEEVKARIN